MSTFYEKPFNEVTKIVKLAIVIKYCIDFGGLIKMKSWTLPYTISVKFTAWPMFFAIFQALKSELKCTDSLREIPLINSRVDDQPRP